MATNRALSLFTEPSGFSFTLKTHLQSIACLLEGRGTRDQVSFLKRALYSSFKAVNQEGFAKASFTVRGSTILSRTRGFKCPVLDLVSMGCWLMGVGEGVEVEEEGETKETDLEPEGE